MQAGQLMTTVRSLRDNPDHRGFWGMQATVGSLPNNLDHHNDDNPLRHQSTERSKPAKTIH